MDPSETFGVMGLLVYFSYRLLISRSALSVATLSPYAEFCVVLSFDEWVANLCSHDEEEEDSDINDKDLQRLIIVTQVRFIITWWLIQSLS